MFIRGCFRKRIGSLGRFTVTDVARPRLSFDRLAFFLFGVFWKGSSSSSSSESFFDFTGEGKSSWLPWRLTFRGFSSSSESGGIKCMRSVEKFQMVYESITILYLSLFSCWSKRHFFLWSEAFSVILGTRDRCCPVPSFWDFEPFLRQLVLWRVAFK